MLAFRKLQPVLVEEVFDFCAQRTVQLLRALGSETDDVDYVRAHAQAVLYRCADALIGELCAERARSYKSKQERMKLVTPSQDARVTYAKLLGKP